MNVCKNCGRKFPNYISINGERHNLHNRKYCLECSPFNQHNTKKIGNDSKHYCCRKCGDTDPNNFPKGRFSECKKCRNEYNKRQLKNNHVRAIQYLGGKCAHCGYDKYICALDIHHIGPSKKDKMFAHHAFWSWKRLKKELENCILLCSNCHRAFHSGLITQDNLIST